MSEFTVNPQRKDPYPSSRFVVKFDGKTPVPGIFRVSGLKRITAVMPHRSGGEVTEDRVSPGITTWEPIVLERGRTHDTSFEDWANLVWNEGGEMSLAHYRKDIRIELLDEQGKTVMAFNITRAWPSEYLALGPLDADASEVALETLTIQHEGFKRDLGVKEPLET
jgi:phage tail-like protein